MQLDRDVIDLVDDDEEGPDEDYESIPLPDDIEAIENAGAGPSRRNDHKTTSYVNLDADDMEKRQNLKEELARLDAEVRTCQLEVDPLTLAVAKRDERDSCAAEASQ